MIADKNINTLDPSINEKQITILGRNFDIKGDLNGVGAVIISGKIEGNISASQVVIEEGSAVLGNITCSQIDISGHVQGSVNAIDVIIREKAQIEGDLNYSTLVMEGGSVVSGKLKRSTPKPSASTGGDARSSQFHPPQHPELVNIGFPIELSSKLMLLESRMSAHLTLINGSSCPSWISLSQDKLGLIVGNQELQQLRRENKRVEMRLHVGSQYFDFNLPPVAGE